MFSSVVTGFVVESFGWLQPDNSADVSVLLLAQISAQLASLSVSPRFINSTTPSLSLDQLSPPSGPDHSSVRINILWFLSLGLSLTASLLAIMVQQWLREYRLPGHLSIRDRVRLRQLRFRALQDWRVPTIVALLPLLLQIALILFLAGLCYLLFTLDRTVAIAFVTFVGVAMSIYFALVVLPILFRHCPYRNPLSHGALLFFGILAVATYGAILTQAWSIYIAIYVYATLTFKALGQSNAPLHFLHDLRQSLIYQMERVASLAHSFISNRDLWSNEMFRGCRRKLMSSAWTAMHSLGLPHSSRSPSHPLSIIVRKTCPKAFASNVS